MTKKRKQKMLKILRDGDYGFSINGTIAINVERIWNEKKRFNTFTKEFASTYSHELLHLILGPIRRKRIIGEEKVIRRMLSEPWDQAIERSYSES